MVRKTLLCLLFVGLVLGVHTPLHAAAPTKVNVYVDQIVQMQPGSTGEYNGPKKLDKKKGDVKVQCLL
jgi:hypothetical protein